MKKNIIILSLLSLLGSITTTAQAASLSCRDLQRLASQGYGFKKMPYETQLRNLTTMQLRKALEIATGKNFSAANDSQLNQEAEGPQFYGFVIGKSYFQVVDIARNAVSHIYLFVPDTIQYSGISIVDGNLLVDGRACDVDFQPLRR